MAWLLLNGLGCHLGFDAVMIRPLYGYEDGCTDIEVTGRAFVDDIAVKLGANEVLGITLPEVGSLNRGYLVSARTPPGRDEGWVNMTVTNGGKTDVVSKAFWYTTCPGSPHVDDLSIDAAVANQRVELVGCNVDTATHRARLIDPTGTVLPFDAALTATCSTARASFGVPALPAGSYQVVLIDVNNIVVWPPFCVEDTGDSGVSCEVPEVLEILPTLPTITTPSGGR